MLIITRKPGDVVCIGKDIAVQILDVNGKQIRIGLTRQWMSQSSATISRVGQ